MEVAGEEERDHRAMVDVFVPDARRVPHEVEERVTKPMEKLLWRSLAWSTSTRTPARACLAIVRFLVGQDERRPCASEQKLTPIWT